MQERQGMCQVCWCTPIIQSLGRLKEDYKFEASLDYIVKLTLSQKGIESDQVIFEYSNSNVFNRASECGLWKEVKCKPIL
jgi:hypothetical protein